MRLTCFPAEANLEGLPKMNSDKCKETCYAYSTPVISDDGLTVPARDECKLTNGSWLDSRQF
jgi:hypothetical protein